MKQKSIAAIAVLCMLVSSSIAQTNSAITPGDEYDIFTAKAPSGDTIYGLRCKNGTTECNYKWESLCKTGKARNSDPLGKVSDAPVYVGGKDKGSPPMRFFVCK